MGLVSCPTPSVALVWPLRSSVLSMGAVMRRREVITLLGSAAAAWPLSARAQQQTAPIPRIAYLGASSPAVLDPRQIEQFKAGLMENGLIDGQNIKVDYLWGEGSPDRLRQHAA